MKIIKFFYKYNWKFSILFVIASIFQGLLNASIIAYLNSILTNLRDDNYTNSLTRNNEILVYSILMVISIILGRQLPIATTKYTREMIHKIRMRIIKRLKDIEYRSFEKIGEEHIYTILINDTLRISYGAQNFLRLFSSIVTIIACLGYLYWLFPLGLLITIITIFAGLGLYFFRQKNITKDLTEARQLQATFFGQIKDFMNGFKDFKLSEKKKNDIYNNYIFESSNQSKNLMIKSMIKYIDNGMMESFFLYGLLGVIIFYFPPFFNDDFGQVYAFLIIVVYMLGPISVIVNSIPFMATMNISIKEISRLEMDIMSIAREEINQKNDKIETKISFETIELCNIYFRYGEEGNDDFSIGPINIKIDRGSINLIFGENGGGKTTFIKILTGLYRPVKGIIRVNGKVLDYRNHQRYRELFGAIYSDFHLFKNLYGLESVSSNKLDELLIKMKIKEKVSIENKKLSTINLSSGQKKRLALMLAILEDRDVLILDEWAAEQDPMFKRIFYMEIIPELRGMGKTLVLISHDEQYYNCADKIFEINNGILSEKSTKKI